MWQKSKVKLIRPDLWLNVLPFLFEPLNYVRSNCISCVASSEPEKRVPNYSSLTARESLDNLRRRQQLQQLRLAQPVNESIGASGGTLSDFDGTYDTIDYDLIKVSKRVIGIH